MTTTQRSGSNFLRFIFSALLFLGVAAILVLAGVRKPFVWIWLAGVPISLVLAVRVSSEAARRLALVAFGASLSLAGLEGAFGFRASRVLEIKASGTIGKPGYIIEDDELGYGPGAGVMRTAKTMLGNQVVYDVAYTISPHRTRVTKGDVNGDTWLFMGCSYQYGEGVKDDETLSAYFSADLGYRANVVNLGFSGYGPHQTLRMLELDRARPMIHGSTKQAVYTAIWQHPARAAGRASWDFRGPRYVLSGDTVSYDGPLHGRVSKAVRKLLWSSHLFRYALQRTLYDPNPSAEEIDRFARIIERSARLVGEKYGAGFTVLFWDEDNDASRRIVARLEQTHLPVVLVSSVIPRDEWSSLKYVVDEHPKPEANRRLAAALAARFRDTYALASIQSSEAVPPLSSQK